MKQLEADDGFAAWVLSLVGFFGGFPAGWWVDLFKPVNVDVGAVPNGTRISGRRQPPAARLEADQAATRRRDPNRAAAAVGVADRHDTGWDQSRGAAGGTTGGDIRVPGIPSRLSTTGFSRRCQSELGEFGLGDRDGTPANGPCNSAVASSRASVKRSAPLPPTVLRPIRVS